MSISKLKYTNLTATKEAIFKNFKATPSQKDALFTILTTIQSKHPKLRLQDISFISDTNLNFFHIHIKYYNRQIKKVINKSDMPNIHQIILGLLN